MTTPAVNFQILPAIKFFPTGFAVLVRRLRFRLRHRPAVRDSTNGHIEGLVSNRVLISIRRL